MKAGFVTVVGRPNVGKSTLVNRIVGQKVAIVTPKPQTTRNRILAVASRPGAQIVFLDTPGIHKPRHEMDRMMLQAATTSLKNVDVALLIVTVDQGFGAADARALQLVQKASVPTILGINKIDSRPKSQILPLIELCRHKHDFAEIVPFSALTGDNVDRLMAVLVERLPEGEPLYPEDTLTDMPERFFVAELVREKILRTARDEVPHSAAVVIEDWSDGDDVTRIEAAVLVERPSQKAILVGRGGQVMKRIGTEARKDIETFLGTRVYLGLHVKVRDAWRENKRLLEEIL